MPSHPSRQKGAFQLLGVSTPIRLVRDLVSKVGPSNADILILGESGVGKEIVARAVHLSSPRKDLLFLPVNCAALTDTLAESELFGHTKGAFTNAHQAKPGYFERAQEGTLFLDEIGELPLRIQAKLLRVIQERVVERVGATSSVKLDVRIVCATNRDLAKGFREGWFRKDLYYRLNVISITIPPLRDRLTDVPILANHFLAKYAPFHSKPPPVLSEQSLQALQNYHYPGNVRELGNIIYRAVVLSENGHIELRDLPSEVRSRFKESARNNRVAEIRTGALLKALKKIVVVNRKGEGRHWHKGIRCVTIDQVHQFLVAQGGKWFSRRSFADHLRQCAASGSRKYKTAGVYLNLLTTNAICKRNGRKANRSAYRVHDRFL